MAEKNGNKKATAVAVAGAILGVGATIAAEALKDKKNRDKVLKTLNDVKKEVMAKAKELQKAAGKSKELKAAKKAALQIKEASSKKTANKSKKK